MRILYLTFYFEPDLCAGSFRNTALVDELARQLGADDTLHVVTTQPNRYASFRQTAPDREERTVDGGCRVVVERVAVPAHDSGLRDQVRSFTAYFRAAHRLTKNHRYDLVVASSSRLFTSFLGARLARRGFARRGRIPLFLDIRDLFRETILELLDQRRNEPFGGARQLVRWGLQPILRAVERYTFGYATHINLVSKGFQSYFGAFPRATYSYFTNGIDDEFLAMPTSPAGDTASPRTLLYAGNVGEGQGLHRIIPQAARQLGEGYRFLVIGDGGAKAKLEWAIRLAGVTNVELRPPVGRQELLTAYQKADYLFVHLNDWEALKRVLPSKLFEYGATDKPIVAGVAGVAAQFVGEHLDNHIVFRPGDADDLVRQLRQIPYRTQVRTDFIDQFNRRTIMEAMARQIRWTIADRPEVPPVRLPAEPKPTPV